MAPFLIEQIDVPEPAEDEVLVRIVGVGDVPATDLAQAGTACWGRIVPSVFGRRGAGVVGAEWELRHEGQAGRPRRAGAGVGRRL